MKKIISIALLAMLLVACSQSPEKKAEALIKESLMKSLYLPDTYEPIDTKVDSAFSPYDDPEFFKELVKIGEMSEEYDELDEKAKDAKSTMALFDSFSSAYGRNQYEEAKEEYDEATAKMEILQKKGQKHMTNVMSMLQEGRKFIGYKAIHNYRADNNAGNTIVGNTVFFIDKDFTQVLYTVELEEYNQMQEAIEQFKENIEDEMKMPEGQVTDN